MIRAHCHHALCAPSRAPRPPALPIFFRRYYYLLLGVVSKSTEELAQLAALLAFVPESVDLARVMARHRAATEATPPHIAAATNGFASGLSVLAASASATLPKSAMKKSTKKRTKKLAGSSANSLSSTPQSQRRGKSVSSSGTAQKLAAATS